jgi:hypothetical protein
MSQNPLCGCRKALLEKRECVHLELPILETLCIVSMHQGNGLTVMLLFHSQQWFSDEDWKEVDRDISDFVWFSPKKSDP